MAEVASAFVSLLPSAKGFGSKLEGQVGGELDKSGSRLGGRMGAAMKVGALAAVAGLAVWVGDSVKSLARIEKINTQTETVIKSTGGAAGVSAKQVESLAGSLENATATEAEAVQEGANFLLTFKNIRDEAGKGNDIFTQTTKAMVDLSRATGTDMRGASLQLGKALNDPVKGISALSRVGITFTDQQKKQIEGLAESGKTMDAQRIILKELESQFGGSGKAFAETTEGQIELAKHAFGTLGETVSAGLLPPLAFAAGKAADFLNSMAENWGPFRDKVKAGLAPVAGIVQGMWGAFSGGGATIDAIAGTVGRIKDTIAGAFAGAGGGGGNPLQSLVAGVQSALPIISTALGKAGAVFRSTILPAVEQLITAFITHLVPVLTTAANTFKTVVLPAVLGVAGYLIANLWPILKKVWSIIATQVVPIIGSLAKWLYGTLYPAVVKIVIAIGQRLKPVFDAIFKAITTSVLPAVQKLLARFREWMPTIQKVIGVVVAVIGWVLKLAASILGKVLPVVIKFAGWLIGFLVNALGMVIGWVIKIIGWIVDFGIKLVNGAKKVAEFASALKAKFGEVVDWVKGLPERIAKAIGNLATLLVDKGKDVMTGLWEGIKSMGGWLKDKLIGFVADIIPGPVAKALGIDSPSKVMAEQAKWIPAGMAKGIEDNADVVQRSMTRLSTGLRMPRVPLDADALGATGTDTRSGGVTIRVDKVEPHDYRAFLGDMQRRTQRAALGGFA